jgi:N-acetylmuramoyl-L-alanine amidase
MSYTIVLDAGHGGSDPGAVNGKKHEADANLAIAKKVGAKLKAKGYNVKYTRTKDVYFSLEERCRMSNNWDADIFVSIHCNAATNKEASGIETWRYTSVGRLTKNLAENVQTKLISATGWKNRKVKKSSTLYVLKHTIASAILVECGFISHPEESKKLFQDKWQEKLANGIVRGIEKTLPI